MNEKKNYKNLTKRLEQAELRKEKKKKKKKILEQIKLEKKIERLERGEALEMKFRKICIKPTKERVVRRGSKSNRQELKEKYKALREQKVNEAIKERVAQLGIQIEDSDNRETLLEKERIYNNERQKIEYALRVSLDLHTVYVFKLIKDIFRKYLSIMR